MADYIKQVMTKDGPKQIDYTALANLPTIDAQVTENSSHAVQSGAVYNELKNKLDAKDGKAANSILFDGKSIDYFATAEDLDELQRSLDDKLDVSVSQNIQDIMNKFNAEGQALDAAQLGGKSPDFYITKEEMSDAVLEEAKVVLGGCWIEFKDENGNPTNEPYVHWIVDEESGVVAADFIFPTAEDQKY